MNDFELFKEKLIDFLSDEYSYAKEYKERDKMELIEDIFSNMGLDASAIYD